MVFATSVVAGGFVPSVDAAGPVINSRADCDESGGTWGSLPSGGYCHYSGVNSKQACDTKGGNWVVRTSDPPITYCEPQRIPANKNCGGISTSIIECDTSTAEGIEGTALWSLLLMAINILTAGVGIAALGGIVYGSVLYTSAGGNPEQVKKARGIFTNVAIGVLAFAGMYALLNFIIPGGIFN